MERLAREFWVKKKITTATSSTSTAVVQQEQGQSSQQPPLPVVVERNHFQKLKAMAQGHAVKLAKLALSPNPHLIAIQFSNDLHR